MTTDQPAFANPLSSPSQGKCHDSSTRCQIRSSTQMSCPSRINRRAMLRRFLFTAGSMLFSSGVLRPLGSTAAETLKEDNSSVCKNCLGTGKIACDLCAGTGFWRALSGSDPKQKYKGVVCPECEGTGTLTCPVCLGTGEGNVKGLLRRRKVEPGPGRILQTN